MSDKPVICGKIHDSQVFQFLNYIKPLIPGVVSYSLDASGMRRIGATQGYERQLKVAIDNWTKGLPVSVDGRSLPWSYGVTVVPERAQILKATLQSLSNAGFTEPIIFVDDSLENSKSLWYLADSYQIVYRGKRRKTYSHWVLSLFELFSANKDAARFALFQDDFVTYKNLKSYLDALPYPEDGYWNLYTGVPNKKGFATTNEDLAKQAESPGFILSNQKGHGALGLVFDSRMLTTIFKSEILITRMWDPTLADGNVDGFVVETMRRAGFKEYIHSPSLLKHTGVISSMGNPTHPETSLFLGEEFNALSFLESNQTGLGDVVHYALRSVGITPERVSDFLGTPCNCEEYRRKLNDLTFWAKKSLTGFFSNAKERLEHLIGVEQ